MLGFDGEYPAVHPKTKFWLFSIKNRTKKAVKHSIEKVILLNFVNLSTTIFPRLWRCSIKKVLLKISQIPLEKNLCRSLFLDKVTGWRSVTLWKKRLNLLPAMYYMTLNVLFFSKIVLHYLTACPTFGQFLHIFALRWTYIFTITGMKSKCIKCTWYFM